MTVSAYARKAPARRLNSGFKKSVISAVSAPGVSYYRFLSQQIDIVKCFMMQRSSGSNTKENEAEAYEMHFYFAPDPEGSELSCSQNEQVDNHMFGEPKDNRSCLISMGERFSSRTHSTITQLYGS